MNLWTYRDFIALFYIKIETFNIWMIIKNNLFSRYIFSIFREYQIFISILMIHISLKKIKFDK